MFDSPADAAQALQAHFDPPRVEILVKALVPAIVLHPETGREIVVGGTRLGGTPDGPQGFAWPRPPAPADPEESARRGNEDAARAMRAHMALGLPYAFIGQIDLAEAAAAGPVASVLPSEGRLLFFYDNAVGPWETGTRTARVIWDTTPVEELLSVAMPGDLAGAGARERAELAKLDAEFGSKGEARSREGTVYGAPAQARILRQTYRLPQAAAIEIDALPSELAAILAGRTDGEDADDLRDAYEEALQAHHDGHPDESWRRQQILGSPMPEQHDPRYQAVAVTAFGKQFLSREEWSAHGDDIRRKAQDWVLLLQVDLKDWMQARFVEGTVYFVIRREDLAARRFETVVAVYQQT